MTDRRKKPDRRAKATRVLRVGKDKVEIAFIPHRKGDRRRRSR